NDRDAVITIAQLLADAGCDVSYTLDPRLALALARKCKPDVALIDLRMPHMTGLHLASLLRAERSLDNCALVALTGYGSDYAWLSVQAGFQALLCKPATFEEVCGTIERFVPRMRVAAA